MADKGVAQDGAYCSEQTTIAPESVDSSPRGFFKQISPEGHQTVNAFLPKTLPEDQTVNEFKTPEPGAASKKQEGVRSAPPTIGSAPPGHWMDMARAGYFTEPPPRGRLEKLADSITDSISSMQEVFKGKPKPFVPWGTAPTPRTEWYWLKGEQCLPHGPNRWERFLPEQESLLTTAYRSVCGYRGIELLADVGGEENLQVICGCRVGVVNQPCAGLPPQLWEPKGFEMPDSQLLHTNKATALNGHFAVRAEDRPLVEQETWCRKGQPIGRAVLLVEETMESAVEEHSPQLMTPEYVVRVFNQFGFAVLGLKKHEIEERTMRELRMRFEDLWPRRSGTPCFVCKGKECHVDDVLKELLKRRKPPPLDIHVVYLTDTQMRLKREGLGTIMQGKFVDLNMEGWFHNGAAQPAQHQPTCCVVN